MNHQRTSFTPVPTHQEGATVPHFNSTVGLGTSSAGGAEGTPSMSGAGTTLRVFCGKGGHCCNQLSGARRSQRWA